VTSNQQTSLMMLPVLVFSLWAGIWVGFISATSAVKGQCASKGVYVQRENLIVLPFTLECKVK
jgi:thiamine transporter ThiT